MSVGERGERLPFRNRIPRFSYLVDVAPDTGGYLRPDWRPQDPSSDPREPWGGEGSGTGDEHGWSNCTMASAALAYALDAGKQSGPWGGDFRHNQDDLSGGTDLYDARTAWQRYGGRELTIRNGDGWAAVEEAHAAGRPIVIQGEGNVPGSEAFDGGHACVISPEPNTLGDWLFGDPLANGWQWVSPAQIRTWAQTLSTGIYFAVGSAPTNGGEPVGLILDSLASWSGSATMQATGASAIVVADKSLVALPVGAVKRVAFMAALGEKYGAWPEGTPVVGIGDELAVLIVSQVRLEPDPAAGDYSEGWNDARANVIDALESWAIEVLPPR
jgi:hypothetical protein